MRKRALSVILIVAMAAVLFSLMPPMVAYADTYTSQPDSAGLDTFLRNNLPTQNNGTSTLLAIGEQNNATDQVRRSLLKFDLSGIPANSKITSATLTLWVSTDLSSTATSLNIYRLKRAWDEGSATWAVYSTGNNWQTAGALGANDYDSTSDFTSTILAADYAADTALDIPLTPALVENIVNGTWPNNGWLLKTSTELNDGWNFYASDHTTAAYRPRLVIEYYDATATVNANNTQTALALTGTAGYNQTATSNAATATAAHLNGQTATAAAFTATADYVNTAISFFLTGVPPTATNTLTPTTTATATRTSTPGVYLSSKITYGSIASTTSAICLLFLIFAVGLTFLIWRFLPRTS
jgi:hypothetical protein